MIRQNVVPVIVERRKLAAVKPLPKKIPPQSFRPVCSVLRRAA